MTRRAVGLTERQQLRYLLELTAAAQPPDSQPPEPKPGESRSDAPGENGQGLELTPEQAQRLLERAKKLDAQLRQAKKRATSRRRAVERDW